MGDMGDYWKDVRAAKKAFKREVVSIKQSPMNAQRWCVGLACGHDVWVTRKAKPQIQRTFCETCARGIPGDGEKTS